MKKRYLLLVLLLGFFFIPKNTFAENSLSINQLELFWRARPVGSSTNEQQVYSINQNQFYRFGASTDEFSFITLAAFVSYNGNAPGTYRSKVTFKIKGDYLHVASFSRASCGLWNSDVSKTSCSIDSISYNQNDQVLTIVNSYNWYSTGGTFIQLTTEFNDYELLPYITYFSISVDELYGNVDNSNVIISQNSTIINQNQTIIDNTKKQLEEQKKTQEEIKKQTEEQKKTNDTLKDDNTDEASTKGSGFFNSFTSESHGLSGIVTAPLQMLQSLTTATCKPLKFKLPFVDNEVTLPCMRSIYEQHFGVFFTLWQTITTGLISYNVCLNFYKKIRDLQNPNNDRIEVLNL